MGKMLPVRIGGVALLLDALWTCGGGAGRRAGLLRRRTRGSGGGADRDGHIKGLIGDGVLFATRVGALFVLRRNWRCAIGGWPRQLVGSH